MGFVDKVTKILLSFIRVICFGDIACIESVGTANMRYVSLLPMCYISIVVRHAMIVLMVMPVVMFMVLLVVVEIWLLWLIHVGEKMYEKPVDKSCKMLRRGC